MFIKREEKKLKKNKRKYKITIACGSGICTSTLAASIIEDILNKHGFLYEIKKCSINDFNTNANLNTDLILTTFKMKNLTDVKVPVIEIGGILAGKIEKAEQEILEALADIE